jgi:hypothetical protein
MAAWYQITEKGLGASMPGGHGTRGDPAIPAFSPLARCRSGFRRWNFFGYLADEV